jgi:hypothetical protein
MPVKTSTKNKAGWVFDPSPPSGQFTGGIPSAYIFKPELDTFVREVLQNSLDARIAGDGSPVEVKFTFRNLDGEDRDRFLEALSWDYLQSHLQAVACGTTEMAAPLAHVLEDLKNQPLTLLRIDDSGTEGLTGDEDSPRTNFSSLCRNVLDTTKDTPGKGGSYGLGKALLWRFSAFSTVLFSSRLSGQTEQQFRFFARTELPSHEVDSARWNGSGWFGIPESVHNGKRAVSVWDETAEKLTRAIHLYRPVQLGTGTSIMVLGFNEPAQEDVRPLADVARDILNSAARWFWPCMISDSASTHPLPSLKVSAEVYENHELIFRGESGPSEELQPFIEAYRAEQPVMQTCHPGEVAKKQIAFNIPPRKSGDAPEVKAAVDFRLIRGEEDSDDKFWLNRIALIRGSGMVVDYRTPSRKATVAPFCGVLKAGNARGSSSEDQALEEFLRDAEPPSHDQWKATERIKEEYKRGARSRLDQLWKDLDEAVIELCGHDIQTDAAAPESLLRLFSKEQNQNGTGAKQKKKDETFQLSELEAFLEDGIWRFSGRIVRSGTQKSPWSFTLRLRLDGETGDGENLLIDSLEAKGTTSVEVGSGTAECLVQPRKKEVFFEGQTRPLDESAPMPDLRLTRVRFEIMPGKGGPDAG